jgi:hypothetical protein
MSGVISTLADMVRFTERLRVNQTFLITNAEKGRPAREKLPKSERPDGILIIGGSVGCVVGPCSAIPHR